MSSLEKKWLIRSSNVVLGPYTKKEIEDLLKEAGIFTHDEVAAPCTFWRALQNHPEFEAIAKEFQSKGTLTNLVKSLSGKLTSTFSTGVTSTTKSGKFTQTDTETLDLSEELDQTQTLPQADRTGEIKEADFELMPSPGPQTSPKTPSYRGVRADPLKSEEKAGRTRTALWIAGLILVLGLVGYIVFQRVIRPHIKGEKALPPEARARDRDRDRDRGRAAYLSGNYEKALQHFETSLNEGALGTQGKIIDDCFADSKESNGIGGEPFADRSQSGTVRHPVSSGPGFVVSA